MPCLRRKSPHGPKVLGTAHGYLFSSRRPRRTPVKFTTVVPLAGTSANGVRNNLEHCIKMEDVFSTVPSPGDVHDCRVVVGRDVFLIVAHWSPDAIPNLALKATCRGLEWRGELSIVQMGTHVPFYKRCKSPSAVNAAISRFVTDFKYNIAMSKPPPTDLDATGY